MRRKFSRELRLAFVILPIAAFLSCANESKTTFSIPNSDRYDASLFRQNCAVCHGPDGHGKTLDDGKIVPSLREGPLKARTRESIYNQIANGGNGMTPFKDHLTERELDLMADFVYHDLRGK